MLEFKRVQRERDVWKERDKTDSVCQKMNNIDRLLSLCIMLELYSSNTVSHCACLAVFHLSVDRYLVGGAYQCFTVSHPLLCLSGCVFHSCLLIGTVPGGRSREVWTKLGRAGDSC